VKDEHSLIHLYNTFYFYIICNLYFFFFLVDFMSSSFLSTVAFILILVKTSTVPIISATPSPTTPCIPADVLCATPTTVNHVTGDCTRQTIDLSPMAPCCDYQSTYNTDVCPSPATSSPTSSTFAPSRCRSAELDAAICADPDQCASMILTMVITPTVQTAPCCETCACFGDPHCESFSRVIDTWVLCDARSKQGSGTEAECLKQLDQNGNTCVWLPSDLPGGKWQIGLHGSECVFDSQSGPLPSMLMYQADDFGLNLVLGERAIITQARLSSNGRLFTMTSDDCFNDFFANTNPWRNEEGVVDNP
jgi:hypothetical protein